ncbi:MAG TPA: sulfotransferase [Anaerolineales bacterium]|nr:sulfotransferase [Anaerolineales bacterium]
MNESPVFIVGIQRSGTTLLAAILAAHSRMSCGPETHFFRQLAKIDPELLVKPDTWPQAAVDFIGSITHNSFSDRETVTLLEKYRIDKNQVNGYLSARRPSISAVLGSVTEQHMTLLGKRRWVEKTPDHIKYLDLIRKYFPDSLIIRIVRDPRDVALSLLKVPWGARTHLEAYIYWKNLDDASQEFFAKDKDTYTLRFEDLVTSPEQSIQELCDRLGVAFELGMLDTSQTGKMINRRNVPWKDSVSQPIDSKRVSVWRTELTEEQNKLAEAILGDRMETYGYPRECKLDQLGEIYPAPLLTSKCTGLEEVVKSGGVRFWRTHPGEKAKVMVYLGDPGSKEWNDKMSRWAFIFRIMIGVMKSKFSKGSMFWLADPDARRWSGYSAFLIKSMLSPYLLKV